MRPEEYSKSATMDVRDACAMALRRVLEGIDRVIGGDRIRFHQVFDEWPTSDDKYDAPAACVLPPPAWSYDDAGGVPKLLEDTVEPNPIPDLVGDPADPTIIPVAFGLYKTAEMLDRFAIVIRAGTPAKRSMLKLAVEDAFQSRRVTQDPAGQRYGLLLNLPEYWGLTARASLIDGANTESEDAAMRNLREATFTVSMQAPKVQLGEVAPPTYTITSHIQNQDGSNVSSLLLSLPERS